MVVIFSVPPDPTSVCLEAYSIHIVTGLIKQWLRELPDPIMTFNHFRGSSGFVLNWAI